MLVKQYKDSLYISQEIIDRYDMMSISFFDIETTGFDKEEDKIILISVGQFTEDSQFLIRQYFAETLEDEAEALNAFGRDLYKSQCWCSYNGLAFDEPFLQRRMEKNKIHFQLPKDHVDLYRLIRPYHKQLGMERCNLKSVERYVGIQREDQIDGGVSVQLYFQYLQSRDKNLKDTIMLHNYEDVLNLPLLFNIVYEVDSNLNLQREDCITDKQLKYLKFLLSKNKVVLETNLERISRKAASKAIDSLLKGNVDTDEILTIINSSY
jgi:uncharacterized protein